MNKKFSIIIGTFYSQKSTIELKQILESKYIDNNSLVVKGLEKINLCFLLNLLLQLIL